MLWGECVHTEEGPMAYIKQMERPRCRTCGGRASVEVFNNRNSSCGTYCVRCGKAKVKELDRQEGQP